MSNCKNKDTQIFSSDEYDIRVDDKDDNIVTNIYDGYVTITKKKPKAKLEWRDITPSSPYKCADDRKLNSMQYPQCEYMYHTFPDDYRLVQFKITGVNARTYYEHPGLSISWWLKRNQTWSTYLIDKKLKLATERNEWSAPIIIPIDFYNKLDEYVDEFNEKLNCGECK